MDCSLEFDNLYVHILLLPTAEVSLVDKNEWDRLGLCGENVLMLPCHVSCRHFIFFREVSADILLIGEKEPHEISSATIFDPGRCGRIAKAGVHPMYGLFDGQ